MKLDDLLDQAEPYATFHDAMLHKIKIDYEAQELTAELELCVGNPDGRMETERERRRSGMLKVSGLVFWAIEPPQDGAADNRGPLWLTSDGSISEAPTEAAKKLASMVTPDCYAWYLYQKIR